MQHDAILGWECSPTRLHRHKLTGSDGLRQMLQDMPALQDDAKTGLKNLPKMEAIDILVRCRNEQTANSSIPNFLKPTAASAKQLEPSRELCNACRTREALARNT